MEQAENEQDVRLEGTSASAAAINSEYVASADNDGIHVQDLSRPGQSLRTLEFPIASIFHIGALTFSTIESSLLAAATGPQVWIFDVREEAPKCILKGNGRVVTSVAFSQWAPARLASGSIDGSICIWSLDRSGRPIWQIPGDGYACDRLVFHPLYEGILAATHQNVVTVWHSMLRRRIWSSRLANMDIVCFDWYSTTATQIIVIYTDGSGTIWELQNSLEASSCPHQDVAEDGHWLDGEADEHAFPQVEDSTSSSFMLSTPVTQARIVARCGMLVLCDGGENLCLYLHDFSKGTVSKAWSIPTDPAVECFTMCRHQQSAELMTFCDGTIGIHHVPVAIDGTLKWDDPPAPPTELTTITTTKLAVMTPVPLDRASQEHRLLSDSLKIGERATRRRHGLHRPSRRRASHFDTPPIHSMTSSMELAKELPHDDEPMMPFLSPAIPSRRQSNHVMPHINESLRLPPLARASFDSIQSSAAHDSDSDDENFPRSVGATNVVLPAGVNVPLPRTCGAQFSQRGELLLFFPSKPQPALVAFDERPSESQPADADASELSRLFPSFGNLKSVRMGRKAFTHPDDADFGTSLFQSLTTTAHISSFDSQASWRAKASGHRTGEADTQTKVQVHDMSSITQMMTNSKYDVICKTNADLHVVCGRNASSALSRGLPHASETWHTLAMITSVPSTSFAISSSSTLQQNQIFESEPSREDASHSVQALATRSPQVLRTLVAEHAAPCKHPFGRQWALQRLFAWVEKRADLQLLAGISALLFSANGTASVERGPLQRSAGSHALLGLPGLAINLSGPAMSSFSSATLFPPVESHSDRSEDDPDSPSKNYYSRTSSRNPSQPTTPYLESSASTPPMTFQAFSRQTSRLSASGSASPEHSRTSFGAAAKSYAQSITDRFAAYGSSPPFKKYGASPSNELSSSLPIGSWSKSVTFAATKDDSKGGRRGSTLAPEDRNNSDRTAAHEPPKLRPARKEGADIPISLKNTDLFYSDVFPPSGADYLPPDLEAKCGIWCRTYAEVLRSEGSIIDAAELEKISSSTGKEAAPTTRLLNSIVPRTNPGQNHPTCAICYAVIVAAEQLCSTCLHAIHPACLEQYLAEVPLGAFSCPSGCGCDCTSHDVDRELVDEMSSMKTPPGIETSNFG